MKIVSRKHGVKTFLVVQEGWNLRLEEVSVSKHDGLRDLLNAFDQDWFDIGEGAKLFVHGVDLEARNRSWLDSLPDEEELELTLDGKDIDTISKAAGIMGQTIEQFVLDSALRKARKLTLQDVTRTFEYPTEVKES